MTCDSEIKIIKIEIKLN